MTISVCSSISSVERSSFMSAEVEDDGIDDGDDGGEFLFLYQQMACFILQGA